MPIIERVSVDGYKSIRSTGPDGIALAPLNVLIGANGSGKSNFLSLFRLLRAIGADELQTHVARAGGAAGLLFLGPKLTERLSVKIDFKSSAYRFTLGRSDLNQFFFEDEVMTGSLAKSRVVKDYSLERGHTESNLKRLFGFDLMPLQDSIKLILKLCVVYHLSDTSASAAFRREVGIQDNDALREDGGNLAAILYWLMREHEDRYMLVVRAIQRVAPFFHSFVIKPLVDNPTAVRLDWRQVGSEDVFPPSALSDGTLRFMCLATLLNLPYPPALVMIDEPELGLHPFAISLVAAMIRSASTRSQIILATQSADLLNGVEPEDVLVTEQRDNMSTFRRLNSKDLRAWLKDYSLGELWLKNVIGGGPLS